MNPDYLVYRVTPASRDSLVIPVSLAILVCLDPQDSPDPREFKGTLVFLVSQAFLVNQVNLANPA